jgi:YggT family protein
MKCHWIKIVVPFLVLLTSLWKCKSFQPFLKKHTFKLTPKKFYQSSRKDSISLAENLHLESYLNNVPILQIASLSGLVLSFPEIVHADANTLAVSLARPLIDSFVNIMSFFFICRTIISWYPKTDLKAFPYSVVAWPTEPLLVPVREFIPPAFGVDISSIVWIMLLSFLREILTGQQGVLTLLERGV